MSSSPLSPQAPSRSGPGGRLAHWQGGIWRRLGYETAGLVGAVLAFGLVVPFFFLGIGSIVVWVGLPILVLATLLARGFAYLERSMLRGLLGADAPTPAPRLPDPGAGWFSRMITPLRDPQSWLNISWVPVHLVLIVVTFPIAITWAVCAVATIAGPAASLVTWLVIPDDQTNTLGELLGFTGATALGVEMVLEFLAGAVFLVTLAPVLRGLTALHGVISRGMLCSRFDSQQELERTRASRTAGRVAESEGLRRLERDLHDGPQQRLIRTLIDLGRAERAVSEDPQRAAALIGEIRGQTNDTLAELRRLSRGIAPPLLVDRGLAAALVGIAGNSAIPTSVRCPDDRLPLHLETGVYYVASEALANANKYSHADRIDIDVAIGPDDVAVRILDDGVGGAQRLAGHGLEGLAERVASLEGALRIDSPAGGGTRVEAVIPCAS